MGSKDSFLQVAHIHKEKEATACDEFNDFRSTESTLETLAAGQPVIAFRWVTSLTLKESLPF